MNQETDLSPIEERLRADADRLLISGNRPSTALWDEYRWRRRRTARRRFAAVAVLTVPVLAAVIVGVARREPPRPSPAQAIAASTRPAEPPVLDTNRRAAVAATPHADATVLPSAAMPFVIGDPASGEPSIRGFYVPEEVRPIDVRDLPPAEREAINAVLPSGEGRTNGGVI